MDQAPGFEHFELLRPVSGTDTYLVYTRWDSPSPTRHGGNRRNSQPAMAGRTVRQPPVRQSGEFEVV